MVKRNSKREPVKDVEPESDEDELDELDLDGGSSSEEDPDDVDADGEEEGEEEVEEPESTSGADEDEDEIDDAILELMAEQAELAQRKAAAKAASKRATQEDNDDGGPEATNLTVGKSRMAAAATRTGGRKAAAAAAAPARGKRSTDDEDESDAAADADAAAGADRDSDSDYHTSDGGGGGAAAAGGDADAAADAAAAAARSADPGSDSSEDERPNRNTVGAVPLEWYKDEEHIGYDIEGKKIGKAARKDRLQQLLDRNDSKKALRTIYDPYNDEEITLSKEELAMVMRIRSGQFPHVEVNPFEPYNDYFSREREVMPIVDRPEPKSRFVPSKWEEKKIVKLVRAIRKGWIKVGPRRDPDQEPQEPPVYLLWADDGSTGDGPGKSGSGLTYIPAPKPQLPGHADSYNPPAEYLPTEEEVAAWQMADPEDRPRTLPTAFTALRRVPAYEDFIKERFERCLDLYLCPRVRRKRLDIKPEALVPQLPKPRDLQPFPTTLALSYEGHEGPVNSIAVDPWVGQWLLSGGQDGTLRIWEVRSGRCWRTWRLGAPVAAVAWCPAPGLRLVSAAVGNSVVLLPSGTGPAEAAEAAAEALQVPGTSGRDAAAAASDDDNGGEAGGEAAPLEAGQLAAWVPWRGGPAAGGGLEVRLRFPVRSLAWHGRGDYFASVAPAGNTQAVVVHQLSKRASQNPFRKNRGRVVRVAFHPSKPFFFVATINHVRVYNLAKQALAKKLLGGGGCLSCLAVHPSGDHVLVGSDDKRVAWYDMDLSNKPYKALRYHTQPPRSVAFHRSYPLFASSADDGTVQVFHGMVYSDLLTNPLIVPVKILRGGHTVVAAAGVTDCAFHTTQPWIFTAGADAKILLYCN